MEARSCCGISSCAAAAVEFASPVEVAYQCGGSVVLLHVQSGQQRVLGSSSAQGIQAFACSLDGRLLAAVLKGCEPSVNVFSTQDLQLQGSVGGCASLGHTTAVALSHDGELLATCADFPELELSIWHWRKGVKLAAVKLHAPVRRISFHPADNSCLLATASQTLDSTATAAGADAKQQACSSHGVVVWQLHKLWDGHALTAIPLQLGSCCQPTCHAWAPEGVYVGCSDGSLLCVSPETGAVLGRAMAVPSAAQSMAAGDGAAGDGAAGLHAGQRVPSAKGTRCISSIAVNKHWLAVACQISPDVLFFQRCTSSSSAQRGGHFLQLLGRIRVSSVGCRSVAFGGPKHAHMAVSTLDGSLLLLSPGSDFDAGQPDPARLQIEPLADWHVGAITGLATAAASSTHLLSCGVDGSVRVWAAAAGGQLVNKRDVGGRLTCCTAATSANCSLLAVGSQAGVLRLINTSDLASLPVVYRSRLFRAALRLVAFSADSAYLAAASADSGSVALLKVADAGQQVDLLGYFDVAGPVLSLCWLPAATGIHKQPQLMLSLASGSIVLISPPAKPAHVSTSSSNKSTLELSAADVHAVTLAAPASMQALAVLPQESSSHTYATSCSAVGNRVASHSCQVVAGGSDGKLCWLQVPIDKDSSCKPNTSKLPLLVTDQVTLPWAAVTLAASPCGHKVLAAGACGETLLLPAVAATAASVLAATSHDGASARVADDCVAPGAAAAALAWSPDSSWAASAGPDGSLLVYSTGAGGDSSNNAAVPLTPAKEAVEDVDAQDDMSSPTVPEALTRQAEQVAYAAAESVREATRRRLEDLKHRLAQVLEANAAAPQDQQLSASDILLNSQLLSELLADVSAEEGQLLSEAPRTSQEQQVQAKRLKALCWDAFEVKRAVCTGLKSGDVQVWNFQLPVQDDSAWAQVAERRREELLAANKHLLDQDFYARSSANSAMLGTLPSSSGSGATSSMDGRSSEAGGADASGAATASSPSAAGDGGSSIRSAQQDMLALLARIKACREAKDCKAADLLLPELAVTTPEAKLMQAEVYRRMVLELQLQFNVDFASLVKQKHADADRLTDLNTRIDELIRELVKIHLVLNPAAADADTDYTTGQAAPTAAAMSPGSGAAGDEGAGVIAAARPDAGGQHDVLTAMQLSAELGAGRLVPFWSAEEDMENLLLSIQPGEVKAAKYLSPAEQAKAEAEEAAAEAARRAAAADSSRGRALQQMMGGRLERSVDEVSELVTSRPAWMVSGDPSTFTEEQLKQYKEYMAKEAAAIEERLKRKGIMETELRTLRAAAEEVASRFDASVSALAAKRLEVLAEVTALETRVLQLVADEEVASVTAGAGEQQAAAAALQAAQQALAAVDQELSELQHLHDQQQEALAALHAEEKAADRAFKRDFAHIDPLVLLQLTSLYKTRLAPVAPPPSGQAASGNQLTTAAGAAAGNASRGVGGVNGAAAAVAPSPRQRGASVVASQRASCVANHAAPPIAAAGRADAQPTGPRPDSAALVFAPLQLPCGHHAAGSSPAGPAAVVGSGVQQQQPHGPAALPGNAVAAAAAHDLCGPLGPAEMRIVEVSDKQAPEALLDSGLWDRFVELRRACARLDLAVREQTAQALCLKRQLQLLLQRQLELSGQVQHAAAALEGLRQQQQQALQDVEVQLRLKQGQVEVWPSGLASIAPEALLVARQDIKGLNSIILGKGEAKLDMLRKMKAFKRGIHQLEWENRKCEMEAQDVISLTQQLQLLHVTKEFQQQVKGRSSAPAGPAGTMTSSGTVVSSAAGRAGSAGGGGGGGGGAAAAAAASGAAAANKEVASLENLLKVREALHSSAIEQKRRQLRSLEAQLAAKRNENATLALHLAGLERMIDEAARLRAAATSHDAASASKRKARSLAMNSKLRDIADAQVAEIAAAQRELQSWQQRCFPCLPLLPGEEDDQQPSGGADQLAAGGAGGAGGQRSCVLPDIKGAGSASAAAAAGGGSGGELLVGASGFAPHGARGPLAAARGTQGGDGGAAGGLFGVKRNAAHSRAYVGPDGKPGLLAHRRG